MISLHTYLGSDRGQKRVALLRGKEGEAAKNHNFPQVLEGIGLLSAGF